MLNKVKNDFEQAIQDLREVNEKLFYDDLKTTMTNHVSRLENEFEKVQEQAIYMQEKVELFEHTLTNLTQGITLNFQTSLTNLEDQLPEIFKEHIETLSNAYELFCSIAEDQKNFIESKDAEWRKRLEQVEEVQTAQLQQINKELQEKISANLSEMSKELQQATGKIDSFEKMFKQTTETYKVQLVNHQQELQKLWNDQDSKLTVLTNQQRFHGTTIRKAFIGLAIAELIGVGCVVGLYFF